MVSEKLEEIINIYEEDKEESRDNFYQFIYEKIDHSNNPTVDQQTTEENHFSFEPQARDIIDTIHEITYQTGKIMTGEGDQKDLETLEWYLEKSQEVDNHRNTKIDHILSSTLQHTKNKIPTINKLEEYVEGEEKPYKKETSTRETL